MLPICLKVTSERNVVYRHSLLPLNENGDKLSHFQGNRLMYKMHRILSPPGYEGFLPQCKAWWISGNELLYQWDEFYSLEEPPVKRLEFKRTIKPDYSPFIHGCFNLVNNYLSIILIYFECQNT